MVPYYLDWDLKAYMWFSNFGHDNAHGVCCVCRMHKIIFFDMYIYSKLDFVTHLLSSSNGLKFLFHFHINFARLSSIDYLF